MFFPEIVENRPIRRSQNVASSESVRDTEAAPIGTVRVFTASARETRQSTYTWSETHQVESIRNEKVDI